MMNGYSNQVLPKPGGIWSGANVVPAGTWKVLTPGRFGTGSGIPGVVLDIIVATGTEDVLPIVCDKAGFIFSLACDMPVRASSVLVAPTLQFLGGYDSAIGGIPFKGLTTATGSGHFRFEGLGEARVYDPALALVADTQLPAIVTFNDTPEIVGRLIL